MKECPKSSKKLKEKVETVVADLLVMSEEKVDITIRDTSRMVNALIQILSECDIITNKADLTHLVNTFEQISKNIYSLAQYEELFIANVIMNEEELKADTLKMKTA